MNEPNPATVEAMRRLERRSYTPFVDQTDRQVVDLSDAEVAVAAAVEAERKRYAPLVEAARAMVESSFLLDAEEQALAAALADLGEGQ